MLQRTFESLFAIKRSVRMTKRAFGGCNIDHAYFSLGDTIEAAEHIQVKSGLPRWCTAGKGFREAADDEKRIAVYALW
jgi:hypothetical protein